MKAGGFSRPFQGLTVCGDDFVIARSADGSLLAAVIDGLGHGYESSLAARAAAGVLSGQAALSVHELLLRCHRELKATRGAAVGILKLAGDGRGEWCGVGNIDVHGLAGQPPSLFCAAGIVGHNLRTTKVLPVAMRPGDVYCLSSDGIASRADLTSARPGAPESVARRIVERFGRAHDDATALVLGFGADALLSESA
ncbi:MAG TPA: hypothetical protein VGE98_16560 [Thermoanaerobaculia bacterium]